MSILVNIASVSVPFWTQLVFWRKLMFHSLFIRVLVNITLVPIFLTHFRVHIDVRICNCSLYWLYVWVLQSIYFHVLIRMCGWYMLAYVWLQWVYYLTAPIPVNPAWPLSLTHSDGCLTGTMILMCSFCDIFLKEKKSHPTYSNLSRDNTGWTDDKMDVNWVNKSRTWN